MTLRTEYQDCVNGLIEKYGFSEEELAGIDVEKLVQDYQLLTRDYTKEELLEILDSEGDMYILDAGKMRSRIFSAEGRKLTSENEEVTYVAFYLNSGTLTTKLFFDFEENMYYVNESDGKALTDGEKDKIKEAIKEASVYKWESHTEGKEEPSTGNYSWKLVFKLASEEYAVYDGYTGDMTNLPEGFTILRDELMAIAQK